MAMTRSSCLCRMAGVRRMLERGFPRRIPGVSDWLRGDSPPQPSLSLEVEFRRCTFGDFRT